MDIVEKMTRIADASRREDGSDIPLGEQCREAAATITRLRSLTAEMEQALQRIERGEIDEGGCRRECVDAGAIARSALSRSQEGK